MAPETTHIVVGFVGGFIAGAIGYCVGYWRGVTKPDRFLRLRDWLGRSRFGESESPNP